MSQESVEKILGRMLTDERFRAIAGKSLAEACLQEGFCLTPAELQLLERVEPLHLAELARRLDPGLCRA
jgi:hypothetical protein